jgi:predicted transcriptional regulator
MAKKNTEESKRLNFLILRALNIEDKDMLQAQYAFEAIGFQRSVVQKSIQSLISSGEIVLEENKLRRRT